jgi:hypothetical protein
MNIYSHDEAFADNSATSEYYSILEYARTQSRKKLRKNNPNYSYYETHHALPKSLFPQYKKEKWNLILLTAAEHLRCHKLLIEMTSGSNYHKMVCAYWKMASEYDENMQRVEMSPEEYQLAKEMWSATMSILNQRPCSEETKKRIGKSNSGRAPSTEAVANSVKTRKGKKRPSYAVKASADAQKGNTNVRGKTWWNNGIKSCMAFNPPDDTWSRGRLKFTDEHRNNIGKSQEGNTKRSDYKKKKSISA